MPARVLRLVLLTLGYYLAGRLALLKAIPSGATSHTVSWGTTPEVAGRAWRAEFQPSPEYSQAQRTWEASAWLILGLAMVALGEFTLLVSTGRELRLADAEDRANALLRAMPDFFNLFVLSRMRKNGLRLAAPPPVPPSMSLPARSPSAA